MTLPPDKIMVIPAGEGREVSVRLKVNPRARRISLRIDTRAREAVAIAPGPGKTAAAIAFAHERADWIARQLAALPEQSSLMWGDIVPFRGKPHLIAQATSGRIVHVDDTGPQLQLRTPGRADLAPGKVIGFLKAAARSDISRYVGIHADTLNVSPAGIALKDTRTRWGSCSSRGNLNFSWRLVCAPEFVLDYVVAHECAHLLEMNHSPRFWAQVERCIPDPSPARKWLNAHGRSLHAIGG